MSIELKTAAKQALKELGEPAESNKDARMAEIDIPHLVAQNYDDGAFGYLTPKGVRTECDMVGDSLFAYAVKEAGDCGDMEEFLRSLEFAEGRLRALRCQMRGLARVRLNDELGLMAEAKGTVMNKQDEIALTEAWHSDTNWLNEKIDDHFKNAQNHAYALGLARGLRAADLTNEEILELAEPFGEFRFGDAQGDKRLDFARAIIAAARNK